MKAARLHQLRDIRLEEKEKPSFAPDEVLIRVKSVGVCGSDVTYFVHGRIGDQIVTAPHILGHECSGEIVEAGNKVRGIKTGTRVAIEPGIPCRRCPSCRRGYYNICPDVRFLGTPPIPGAYREYMSYPADFVFPLPSCLNYDEGAMLEPLAVAIHAVDLGNVRNGDSVAILGSGSIGLLTLQCAISVGASFSLAADLVPERLILARKYGADVTIDSGKEDAVRRVKEETNGQGVDVVFEAAGEPETFRESIRIVRPGGTIVLIGICREDMISLDFQTARRRELVIKNVRRFRHTYGRAISLTAKGKVEVKSLVTHRFDLSRLPEALKLVEERRDGVVKAVIEI